MTSATPAPGKHGEMDNKAGRKAHAQNRAEAHNERHARAWRARRDVASA
jgi:hypothetical protein